VRRQSEAATALWLRLQGWSRPSKRRRAALAAALQNLAACQFPPPSLGEEDMLFLPAKNAKVEFLLSSFRVISVFRGRLLPFFAGAVPFNRPTP
jgi:hypothetical protein